MTEKNPAIFLQAGAHPAEDVRRFISAVTNDSEGIVDGGDMLVAESGTPAMSVQVAGGRAFVSGDEATYAGTYFVENRGSTTVTVTASDGTNGRIDLVVAEVDDSDYSGATDAWALKVVAGTPAGTPAAPTLPDNAYLLATVTVAATVTTIVDANIADNRSLYNPGYDLVKFTSSSTFTKASYPWAKAVRVRLVGAGGGSGGCASTDGTQRNESAGGGGGGYSEKRILVADLGTSETVTIGARGAAGVAGNNTGGTGGTTSFGAHASATGGNGGGGAAATSSQSTASRGYRGAGSSGDVNLPGGTGGNGATMITGASIQPSMQNWGGGSMLSGGVIVSAAATATAAIAGESYGGGASGGRNNTSDAARAGALGGAAVVIVEVYG